MPHKVSLVCTIIYHLNQWIWVQLLKYTGEVAKILTCKWRINLLIWMMDSKSKLNQKVTLQRELILTQMQLLQHKQLLGMWNLLIVILICVLLKTLLIYLARTKMVLKLLLIKPIIPRKFNTKAVNRFKLSIQPLTKKKIALNNQQLINFKLLR